MIKTYDDGQVFLDENGSFLRENKYMSSFFFWDAPLLRKPDENNYIVKVTQEERALIALKVEPFNLLLYGDKSCLNELITFLRDGQYKVPGLMCPAELGEAFMKEARVLLDQEFHKAIGLDFMEATEYGDPSSKEVTVPNEDDLEEILECFADFLIDCGLTDAINVEKNRASLPLTRVIKVDGKIASFARMSPETDESIRVCSVYTRPEYRGKGYARKVVNCIKNEILAQGKKATLNVDQKNPISNHVYQSLGFKKVFSQGVYLPKDNMVGTIAIYEPKLEDLWFRAALLRDEKTMSYNHAWGGTIIFAREDWEDWYSRWVVNAESVRLYRYVRDEDGAYIGEIAYHLDQESGYYLADVIIHAKYRGKGYGGQALDALCTLAKENGVKVLHDDIAIDNPAISLFLKHGFYEEKRDSDKIYLRKDLTTTEQDGLTNVLSIDNRADFRLWLEQNAATEKECWVNVRRGRPRSSKVFYYLDAVEEALCFGWIDSTQRLIDGVLYQRFSPRSGRGLWTELNKERVRRLIKLNLMTPLGKKSLPPLGPRSFKIDPDVEAALKKARVYSAFKEFPPLYQRVRAYNVAFYKKLDPHAFARALSHLIEETKKARMYGEWNDYGRLLDY